MSYNAVLTDKNDEQVLPITTAENVFYSGSKTVKEAIDDIIEGRTSAGERVGVIVPSMSLYGVVTATKVE